MSDEPYSAQYDTAFQPHLSHVDRRLLESPAVSACGLWSDLTIAYLSPGWFAFAAANGGEPAISSRWPVGAQLLDGVSSDLRDFYADAFRRCLAEQRPWQHGYECSSAVTYRWLELLAYPLEGQVGLLLVHSIRVEQPQERSVTQVPSHLVDYLDADRLLHQCSYCRRTRRCDRAETWDFVPAWIEQPPPQTSHGICESCYAFYAPRIDRGLELPLPRNDIED